MKIVKYLSMAIVACLFVACTYDNPVAPEPEQDGPTPKEKAMVPQQMTWKLDSSLIIFNPGTPIETCTMMYANEDIPELVYTLYPYEYQFPADLVFFSDWDGEAYPLYQYYNEDYCKYLCTIYGEPLAAGYLVYFKDMFTFRGMKQGGWVEFMIRETDPNWNSDVWTLSFDSSVEPDGTVLVREIEYYSRVEFVDEVGGRGGSASLTVNGTTFSVYNAYWDVAVANGSDAFYTLQFYNFDVLGAADPMEIVTITYKVPNGSQTAIATGEFSDYEVAVTKMGSNEALDKQYYTFGSDNPGTKLTVTKNGSGYLVQFGAMKYTDGNNPTTYVGTPFSFSGGFKKGTLLQ